MRNERRYKLEIQTPKRLARVKYYTTMQGARNAANRLKKKRLPEERVWGHVITRPFHPMVGVVMGDDEE